MLRINPNQMRNLEAGLHALGFTLHQARALLLLHEELSHRLAPAYISRPDRPVRRRLGS